MKNPQKFPPDKQTAFERYLARIRHKHMFNDEYLRVYIKFDKMYNGGRATEFMLRVLTGIKDLKLKELHYQDELTSSTGKKVILDAHCIDTHERDIDVEVQRAGSLTEILMRIRLYQGMMDTTSIDPGEHAVKLHESYIIFVMEQDPLGLGWPFYERESTFKGTGVTFNDGSHVILVNGSYNGDDEHGKLMRDFRCPDVDAMNDSPLKTVAEWIKKPQGETKMKDDFEDIWKDVRDLARKEGRAEGREEGREEGRLEAQASVVRNVMSENRWTLDKTLEFLHLSKEEGKSLMPLL